MSSSCSIEYMPSFMELYRVFPEFSYDEVAGSQDEREDNEAAKTPFRCNGSKLPPPITSIATGRSIVENVEGSCKTSALSSIGTIEFICKWKEYAKVSSLYYEDNEIAARCLDTLGTRCRSQSNSHIDMIDRAIKPIECSHWSTEAGASQMGITRVTTPWSGLLHNTSPFSGSDRRPPPNSRWYRPLAIAATTSCLIPVAAAVVWAPQLRIGSGFAGFALGVVPIPLRRDERVKPMSLIPIYALSLACTAIFITSQYYSIIRGRGQYLFGTFVLAAHFVGVLSQATNNMLDGIIDLGPALLPAVAALVSMLFPRHQPSLFRYPLRAPVRGQETITGAGVVDPQIPEEADIALERLTQLNQAAAGLIPTDS
ncbi:hypothetical protein F5Y03DRAFT_399236 [Xylaria venustula]|nr:hypothetical protein F5Y03DRAFT_399236 [Xylaria venustula]